MSAFSPDSYAEAVSTYKPMSRNTPLQRAGKKTAAIAPKRGKAAGAAKARKRAPRKKVKRVKVSTLKNRAWTQFSIFIRTRNADPDGFVICVTCGVRKHWQDGMQAGHFIAGRLNSNLFDERGCHEQCSTCNVIRAGNGPKYYQFMARTYGEEVINDLLRQNDQTKKWVPMELDSIYEKYRALNDANPLVQVQEA